MGIQALEDKCCLSQYQLHLYIIINTHNNISEDINYNGLTVFFKINFNFIHSSNVYFY